MKKIVFVSDSIFPYFKGGKELRLYEISKRLVNEDTEVHIYTMKWWDGLNVMQREGVHYHALCKQYPLYTKNGRRSIVEALMFGLATFKMLFEKFDTIDVDQMPFYPLFSARLVCWIKRKKLIATWHEVWGREYWSEYSKGLVGFIGYITEFIALRLPDTIISNSTHTTKRLHEANVKSEIVTIPLGVDVEMIQATPVSINLNDVIYVGRLLRHKNVSLLVDAIVIAKKTLPNISLTIMGNGPEKKNIENQIAHHDLGGNIKIRTDVDSDLEKYSIMKSSKVLVLPSEREGFGLVMIEANAAGIPAITVNCSDNAAKDLITEGVNGLVVELSPEVLASSIVKVLQNKYSFKPNIDIEKYDWFSVVENIRKNAYKDDYFSKKINSNSVIKLCVVAPYFYPRIGGMEMYAHNLAKRLHASGKYEVHIITSNDTGSGYIKDVVDGMVVHRLPILFSISNTPIGLTWYWTIKKIFKQIKPDLVNVHTPVTYMADIASLATHHCCIPSVVTYHAGSMLKGKLPIDFIIGAYEYIFLPKLLRRAGAIGAVYPQFLIKSFPDIANKISFLPAGVDLNRFKQKPLPKVLNTVLFVGRIEKSSAWKGLEQLIIAMSLVHLQIPSMRLEIIGGGDAVDVHRKHAHSLGLDGIITFHGPQIGQPVVDAFQRSSLLVLPSTSDSEAYGTVLIEAMASSRPIVASRIGGIPNVITSGVEGLLVEPNNPPELANAIISIVTNRSLAEQFAHAGSVRLNDFSWEKRTREYNELFKNVIEIASN